MGAPSRGRRGYFARSTGPRAHYGCGFFGLDEQRCLGLNLGMIPGFDSEVLCEDERTVTARSSEGAVTRSMRDGSSMAQYLSWPVKARDDFEQIKRRYEPSNPGFTRLRRALPARLE